MNGIIFSSVMGSSFARTPLFPQSAPSNFFMITTRTKYKLKTRKAAAKRYKFLDNGPSPTMIHYPKGKGGIKKFTSNAYSKIMKKLIPYGKF